MIRDEIKSFVENDESARKAYNAIASCLWLILCELEKLNETVKPKKFLKKK